MKVKINNSCIKNERTIDIKPLTIILGRNNVGKTRLVYSFVDELRPYHKNVFYFPIQYTDAYCAPRTSEFNEVADVIQDQILHGKFEFGEDETFDSYPICEASLSAKTLSNFVNYLRFDAEKNDLVVFSEPETNLHPFAQVQFAELIGLLVNKGINIIMTIHSPYIVDHLSNLIIAKNKVNDENINKIESMFYLKNHNSFLSKDNVAAYLLGNGEITELLEDTCLINWSTFGDVSNDLRHIFYDLINREDA